jgi:hypothetical protein
VRKTVDFGLPFDKPPASGDDISYRNEPTRGAPDLGPRQEHNRPMGDTGAPQTLTADQALALPQGTRIRVRRTTRKVGRLAIVTSTRRLDSGHVLVHYGNVAPGGDVLGAETIGRRPHVAILGGPRPDLGDEVRLDAAQEEGWTAPWTAPAVRPSDDLPSPARIRAAADRTEALQTEAPTFRAGTTVVVIDGPYVGTVGRVAGYAPTHPRLLLRQTGRGVIDVHPRDLVRAPHPWGWYQATQDRHGPCEACDSLARAIAQAASR